MRRILIVLTHIILISTELFSQSRDVKDSVTLLRSQSLQEPGTQSELNTSIQEVIAAALKTDDWHTLSSSDAIAMCASQDSNLLVFSWNQVLKANQNAYYGLIAYRKKNKHDFEITYLTDTTAANEATAKNQKLSYNETNWPGATYYKLIGFKRKGGKSYALLGWRGEDMLLSAKLIDVLTISKRSVNFGLPVFKTNKNGLLSRIYLEYPSDISFPLKYSEGQHTIAYEELIPRDLGSNSNNYDLSTSFNFKGFIYEKGMWSEVSNLDMRMPKKPKKKEDSANAIPQE